MCVDDRFSTNQSHMCCEVYVHNNVKHCSRYKSRGVAGLGFMISLSWSIFVAVEFRVRGRQIGLYFVDISVLTWFGSVQFRLVWKVQGVTGFTQVRQVQFGLEILSTQYKIFTKNNNMGHLTNSNLLCCYLLLWLRSAKWQAIKTSEMLSLTRSTKMNQWI